MGRKEITPKRFRFAKKMIWLFLVASILLLVYTLYSAEIRFQGTMSEKYFKYYLISIAGIFFWCTVFRLQDEIKLNIVMLTTSLVVGLYMAETILEYIIANQATNIAVKAEAARVAGVEFDTRSKYQVYKELKSRGTDAVPTVHPSNFIKTNGVAGSESLYPLGGVSGRTTVYCNEGGKRAIFLSDRYGFNNPDSEWNFPQTEWLLIGDSFTQGACVNPGEEIAGQIRSITGESVINLGSGGSGPLIELAMLKEYAESRKPKIVLWIYCEDNDLGDLPVERLAPLLMSYLQPEFTQNLIQKQTKIDDRLLKYISEAESGAEAEEFLGRIAKVLRLYNLRKRLRFKDFEIQGNPLFSEILTKARDRTAAWGGKLYFIYLPDFKRYSTEGKTQDLYMKHSAVSSTVVDVAKSLNIPVIDMHQKVFTNHPDPLSLFPLRLNGHYNAEGYSEVAKAIVMGVKHHQQMPPLVKM